MQFSTTATNTGFPDNQSGSGWVTRSVSLLLFLKFFLNATSTSLEQTAPRRLHYYSSARTGRTLKVFFRYPFQADELILVLAVDLCSRREPDRFSHDFDKDLEDVDLAPPPPQNRYQSRCDGNAKMDTASCRSRHPTHDPNPIKKKTAPAHRDIIAKPL